MKKHNEMIYIDPKTCKRENKNIDFEKEVLKVYPWIINLAKKYCHSAKDAEDLAGDTVCKILENKNKFNYTKDLKPWCIAILRNTFLTRYNKSTLIKFVGYEYVLDSSTSFNTLSKVYYNELVSAIKKCSKKSICMESLALYAKGYSYDEISILLHIPVGTVRSRISAGRKVLRQELNIQ